MANIARSDSHSMSPSDRPFFRFEGARTRRTRGMILALALAHPLLGTPAMAQVPRSPTPEALIEVSELSFPVLSPDGRYLAILVRRADVATNTTGNRWVILDKSQGWREITRSASGDSPGMEIFISQPSAAEWAADSRSIVYRAVRDGQSQLWRLSVSGAESALTDDPADVMAFHLIDDTAYYAIGADRDAILAAEKARQDSGYYINVTTLLYPFNRAYVFGRMADWQFNVGLKSDGGLLDRLKALGNDGRAVVRPVSVRAVALEHPRLARAATADEARRYTEIDQPLIDGQRPPRGTAVSRSGDGAIAFIASTPSEDSNQAQRFELRVRDSRGRIIACAHPLCTSLDNRRLNIGSWSGGEVTFTASAANQSTNGVYAWNPRAQRVRRVVENGTFINTGYFDGARHACPVVAAKAYCIQSAPGSPEQLVAIDVETGSVSPIYDPNTALRRLLPPVERLDWIDRFGRAGNGYLVRPAGFAPGHRYPLIINGSCRTGFLRGGSGFTLSEFLVAQHGMVALCVNFNGDEMTDKRRREGETGPKGADAAIMSMKTAIDLLDRRGMIDRSAIGYTGQSFTAAVGHYAMWKVDLFKAFGLATVDFYQPVIIDGMIRKDGDKDRTIPMVTGMPMPDKDVEAWRNWSVLMNIDRAKAPVLYQLADSESVGSQYYYNALEKRGIPVELYSFPNESHQKSEPRHILAVNLRNLDWMRFWLANDTGFASERPEEFARWQRMKSAWGTCGNANGCE